MVVGGCHGLVAEHWRLKPKALGFIPSGTSFLSFPLPLQRSSDSNGPDNLYWSSDLVEPDLSGSLCCDEAQIISKCTYICIYVVVAAWVVRSKAATVRYFWITHSCLI